MLSDFLTANGGEKIKKACYIQQRIWFEMMNNERAPSLKTFNRIVDYLADGQEYRVQAYRKALFDAILQMTKHLRRLDLCVHVQPMAAPRPRFSTQGRFGRVYNPPNYTAWKRNFSDLVGNVGMIVGPCTIEAEYHFKTGSSHVMGPHTTRKDIDNLDKALLDSLQLNGLLEDDKNVYQMTSTKLFGYQNKIKFIIRFDDIWTNKKGAV